MAPGPPAEEVGMESALLKARASFEALGEDDPEAYAGCFTEEGAQTGPLGGAFHGREDLRRFHREFRALFRSPRFEWERWFTRGLEVALAWSCEAEAGGRIRRFRGVSHWTHAPSGHIRRLRIHWNPSEDLGGDPGDPPPPLGPAWVEALNGGTPAHFAPLLSEGVSLEGMASGGTLRGRAVVAQHLAHVVRRVGGPSFSLDGIYRGTDSLALAWTGAVPDQVFRGITLLEAGDGLRIDRVLIFWGAGGEGP